MIKFDTGSGWIWSIQAADKIRWDSGLRNHSRIWRVFHTFFFYRQIVLIPILETSHNTTMNYYRIPRVGSNRIWYQSDTKAPNVDPQPGLLKELVGLIEVSIKSNRIPIWIRSDPIVGLILLSSIHQNAN